VSIDMSPETERLVRAEIRSGHFRSVDDLIISGVNAWREKYLQPASLSPSSVDDAENLVELFENSPFKGLGMKFERDQDYGRETEL
jgi:Arc/MetJ-type ribon-helix-helix transcriptional regulator